MKRNTKSQDSRKNVNVISGSIVGTKIIGYAKDKNSKNQNVTCGVTNNVIRKIFNVVSNVTQIQTQIIIYIIFSGTNNPL